MYKYVNERLVPGCTGHYRGPHRRPKVRPCSMRDSLLKQGFPPRFDHFFFCRLLEAVLLVCVAASAVHFEALNIVDAGIRNRWILHHHQDVFPRSI